MTQARALVTGAGRRLGREMALYLGGRGFDVAIHYSTSKAQADEVVATLHQMGRKAVALQADLTREDEMQTLVDRAVDGLGGTLTLLVNNASIFEADSIASGTRTSWDRHIESNLRAPYVLTQKFAAQSPSGTKDAHDETVASALIVNMLDQRIKKLTPAFSSYTIAKMGLWALTQTAAQGLAPHIRVNAIAPGTTLPGEGQTDASFRKQRAANILGRGPNVADITAALGYFIDAPSVTGQVICPDGGQHLGWLSPDVLAAK